MAPTSTLTRPGEVVLRDGKPYVLCPSCNGGPVTTPMCAECFGSGWAPVFEAARFAFARHQAAGIEAPSVDVSHVQSGPGPVARGEKKSFANKFAGKCVKCTGWVEAGEGHRIMEGQGWATVHAMGQCQEVKMVTSSEAPAAAPAVPAGRRPNQYPGKCITCSVWIEAGAELLGKDANGKFGPEHVVCPEIDTTPTLAEAAKAFACPAGKFALETDGVVKFYLVEHGDAGSKWEGFTFLSAQGSDEFYPVKNRETRTEIFARINADPLAALKLYGVEIGRCGHCGRKLTSDWRKVGIGPVCIRKVGY